MKSTQISDAARIARNEYAREWRKRNPDKVKKANERYWERKAKAPEGNSSATQADNTKEGGK